MRFDRTFIAIRQRKLLDIFDLALHVTRDHLKALLILLLLGALPWQAINWWITTWMVSDDYVDDYLPLYVWITTLLIVSQAQLGTTFITHYLGQAMFLERPSVWKTVKQVLKTHWYFYWIHGAARLVVPTIGSAWLLTADNAAQSVIVPALLLPGLVSIGLLVRAFRPFVSEILLLEKTPISPPADGSVDFARRSRALHVAGTELFGRFLLAALIAAPIGFILYAGLLTIDAALNLHGDWSTTRVTYFWPLALWLVAGLIAVVRFLSYIDIRIRQEGWAIELQMRAEALRLAASIES